MTILRKCIQYYFPTETFMEGKYSKNILTILQEMNPPL